MTCWVCAIHKADPTKKTLMIDGVRFRQSDVCSWSIDKEILIRTSLDIYQKTNKRSGCLRFVRSVQAQFVLNRTFSDLWQIISICIRAGLEKHAAECPPHCVVGSQALIYNGNSKY